MVGVSYSGTPSLPRPSTPGNVLLAIMFAAGNTTRFPTAFRALDNPPVSPAVAGHAALLGAGQTAAWTIIGSATTDYKGQNIGGPCSAGYGGPYHGAAGTCTSGLMVAAAWRHVAPGEVTTKPAQFSTEITDSQTLDVPVGAADVDAARRHLRRVRRRRRRQPVHGDAADDQRQLHRRRQLGAGGRPRRRGRRRPRRPSSVPARACAGRSRRSPAATARRT